MSSSHSPAITYRISERGKGRPELKGCPNFMMYNEKITVQTLGKILLYNEFRMSRGVFVNWMTDASEDKDCEFCMSDVIIPCSIEEKHYPVLMSKSAPNSRHAGITVDDNTRLSAALRMLEIPIVGLRVAENKVIWDDELREAVPDNELGVLNTVVINKRDGFAVVFESGQYYIRIVTVSCRIRDFFIKPEDFVIEIDEYGAITSSAPEDDISLKDAMQQLAEELDAEDNRSDSDESEVESNDHETDD